MINVIKMRRYSISALILTMIATTMVSCTPFLIKGSVDDILDEAQANRINMPYLVWAAGILVYTVFAVFQTSLVIQLKNRGVQLDGKSIRLWARITAKVRIIIYTAMLSGSFAVIGMVAETSGYNMAYDILLYSQVVFIFVCLFSAFSRIGKYEFLLSGEKNEIFTFVADIKTAVKGKFVKKIKECKPVKKEVDGEYT